VIRATLTLNVGRISILRVLVASLLVGSAALAQQGLIVEPWRRAHVPLVLPVEPARAMPASGLDASGLAKERSALPPAVARARAEPATVPLPLVKWSPPVVELLVDPWAKARAVARAPRLRWVPQTVEIVDPWAAEAPRPPHVATGPVATERSTIF
jgi:hypothetical protein